MKILLTQSDMSFFGGSEYLITKLSHHLKEKGHEVCVMSLSMSEDIKKELKVSYMDKNLNLQIGIFGIVDQYQFLSNDIKKVESQYDVICAFNFPSEMIASRVAKPVVWFCNEPPSYWLASKYQVPHRLLLATEKQIVKKYISKAVVADEFNKQRFIERYSFEPKIVPYGIDYDFFSIGNSKQIKDKYNLHNKFLILQVGVITEQKNQLRSLEVINNLKDKIPNICLVLAGKYSDMNYVKKVKQFIVDNNLTKQVKLLGDVYREEVRDLYHACNILIHPIKQQGGWLVPFECMCVGKQIIVSDEFTAVDIIRDNSLCLVRSDPEDAIMNIEKYTISDRVFDHQREWVKENLSWEKFGDRMIEIFEEEIK